MHDTLTESGTAHPRASAYISGKAQMPVLSRHMVMCQRPRKMCGTQVCYLQESLSNNSTPHISKTTEPISIKFTYFMPSIYMTLQSKFKENWFSSLRDICF